MSYCDCGSSSYPYRAETRKAAKAHRCCECGARIAIGEDYEYVTGKCEGEWFDCRTCSRCVRLREYVVAHVPCFCIEHHNLLEPADEAMREYAADVPGMGMEYGRLRVAVKRGAAR